LDKAASVYGSDAALRSTRTLGDMSAKSGSSPARIAAFSIAALVVPFLVVAVVVAISRMLPLRHEGSVAFIALPLSIAAGVYCLWQLPLSRTWHAIGTMAYVAAGIFALSFFSLNLVCHFYGDCL